MGGVERSYNNNFLLREDSLEEGGSGVLATGATTMTTSQPQSSIASPIASAQGTSGASDQAYSMPSYGKTFCEDLFSFFMQLPSWGKGVVGIILVWITYIIFH